MGRIADPAHIGWDVHRDTVGGSQHGVTDAPKIGYMKKYVLKALGIVRLMR